MSIMLSIVKNASHDAWKVLLIVTTLQRIKIQPYSSSRGSHVVRIWIIVFGFWSINVSLGNHRYFRVGLGLVEIKTSLKGVNIGLIFVTWQPLQLTITFYPLCPFFFVLLSLLSLFGFSLPRDLLIWVIYVSNSSTITGHSQLLETVPFSSGFFYKCHMPPVTDYSRINMSIRGSVCSHSILNLRYGIEDRGSLLFSSVRCLWIETKWYNRLSNSLSQCIWSAVINEAKHAENEIN